jgi:hypothetical protein
VSSHRNQAVLSTAFGRNEWGLPDLPSRIGSIRVARLLHARERGGCSFCFPHGYETTNSTASKNGRSWKGHRVTRYR